MQLLIAAHMRSGAFFHAVHEIAFLWCSRNCSSNVTGTSFGASRVFIVVFHFFTKPETDTDVESSSFIRMIRWCGTRMRRRCLCCLQNLIQSSLSPGSVANKSNALQSDLEGPYRPSRAWLNIMAMSEIAKWHFSFAHRTAPAQQIKQTVWDILRQKIHWEKCKQNRAARQLPCRCEGFDILCAGMLTLEGEFWVPCRRRIEFNSTKLCRLPLCRLFVCEYEIQSSWVDADESVMIKSCSFCTNHAPCCFWFRSIKPEFQDAAISRSRVGWDLTIRKTMRCAFHIIVSFLVASVLHTYSYSAEVESSCSAFYFKFQLQVAHPKPSMRRSTIGRSVIWPGISASGLVFQVQPLQWWVCDSYIRLLSLRTRQIRRNTVSWSSQHQLDVAIIHFTSQSVDGNTWPTWRQSPRWCRSPRRTHGTLMIHWWHVGTITNNDNNFNNANKQEIKKIENNGKWW